MREGWQSKKLIKKLTTNNITEIRGVLIGYQGLQADISICL